MKILDNAIFSFLVLTFSVGIQSVSAQPPGGPGQHPDGPRPNDPGHAVIQALDADGNREISAEEIENATGALRKLDTNGDGKISNSDIQSPEARERGPRNRSRNGADAGPRRRPNNGENQRPPRDGRGAGGPPNPERMVQHAMQFDLDGDGKLDSEELLQFAQQMRPHGQGQQQRRGRPGGRPGDAGNQDFQRRRRQQR